MEQISHPGGGLACGVCSKNRHCADLVALAFGLILALPAAFGVGAPTDGSTRPQTAAVAEEPPNQSPATPVSDTSLRVAVAANFRAPFEALAGEFKDRHGIELVGTFGSSGLLTAQIRQGAPYDVFFSADTMRPQALIGDGLAVAPPTVYARGRVALVNYSQEPILPVTPEPEHPARSAMGKDLEGKRGAAYSEHSRRAKNSEGAPGSEGATHWPVTQRIGIANPKLAPYGAAAKQCLQKLGVWQRLQGQLVFGNNVNQVDHFLESGALKLGFVALGQLLAKHTPRRNYWVCPAHFHAPINQAAVMLTRSPHRKQTQFLLNFVTRPETQARLQRLGY